MNQVTLLDLDQHVQVFVSRCWPPLWCECSFSLVGALFCCVIEDPDCYFANYPRLFESDHAFREDMD